MKRLLCVMGIIALLAAACGKRPVLNLEQLRKTFKTGDAASQTLVEKVATAVKGNDYPTAMATLQKLAHQPKLTPDQQRAVLEAMTAVQQRMTTPAPKVPAR
jgi:hypothetical protein